MISAFQIYKGDDFTHDQPKLSAKNTYYMHETANGKQTLTPTRRLYLTENSFSHNPRLNWQVTISICHQAV
jgi:hypothetical protein